MSHRMRAAALASIVVVAVLFVLILMVTLQKIATFGAATAERAAATAERAAATDEHAAATAKRTAGYLRASVLLERGLIKPSTPVVRFNRLRSGQFAFKGHATSQSVAGRLEM